MTKQGWVKRKLNGNGIPWNKGKKLPQITGENNSKFSRIRLTCLECKKEFEVKNYRKDTARYCSQKCAHSSTLRNELVSKKLTGRKVTHGFKKGHRQSVESRKKMSIAKIGKVPPNKKEDVFISCLNCGIEKKIKPAYIGRAKFCSKPCANKGKDFGKTPEQKRIRESIPYKLWKLAVFERDNFTCVICFERGGKLNADHIKPFARFPELRLEVSNGRTLCEDCHKMTETYGNRNNTVTSNFHRVATA